MSHLDVYQDVTNSIVALLEQGVIPWRKPWTPGSAPQNLISRKAYRGVNSFLLTMHAFSSPYWLTYNQAKQRGGYIRRGEHGTRIIYWNIHQKEVEQDGETGLKSYAYLNTWTVFNLEQCEDIEAPVDEQKVFNPIESAEQVLASMPHRPSILHVGGNRAFYRPLADEIHMPNPEQFNPAEAYYSTLYHELGHSTGHASRLARPDLMNNEYFGSIPYCREELVAEMTAAMLCGVTGIAPAVVENSAAYIQGWLGALQDDKKLLITAAGQAQKAADFILNAPAIEEEVTEAA